MKKRLSILVAVFAIAAITIGMIGSGAWFTDSKTSSISTLTSANLEIDGPGVAEFNLGAVPPMAPGDKTGYVSVRIQNTGNTNLIWFGDLVITGNGSLKQAIYIDDAKMEFLGGTWTEPDDHFITNGLGSGPYPDWYNTLAGLSIFHVVGLDVFDGNNGMGDAPYEFMGALKPGYAYNLTLRFGFAELADNNYENLSALNLSFKVDATQPKAAAIHLINPSWDSVAHETFALDQISHQTP